MCRSMKETTKFLIPQKLCFLVLRWKFVLCLRIVQHLPCFPQPCTDVTSLNAWLDSIPLYRNAYDGECKGDMLLSKWCGRLHGQSCNPSAPESHCCDNTHMCLSSGLCWDTEYNHIIRGEYRDPL